MIDNFMVEIKIDTSKSSKQDIKRAIEFLKGYLDEPMVNQAQEMDIAPGALDIFTQDEPTININKKQEPEDTDLEIKPIFY